MRHLKPHIINIRPVVRTVSFTALIQMEHPVVVIYFDSLNMFFFVEVPQEYYQVIVYEKLQNFL